MVVGGQVVERTKGVVLPKLMVSLLRGDSTAIDSMMTGPDGTFMLQAAASGSFRVRLQPSRTQQFVSDTMTVAAGDYVMRSFPIDAVPEPYYEFQVDRPAVPVKGSKAPRYPADLLADGVSGCALVQFVVDVSGQPEIVRQLVQQPFYFTIEPERTVVYGQSVERITSPSGRLPRPTATISPLPRAASRTCD